MEGATESGTAPTHHCFVLQRQLTFTSARAPGPPMRSMRALYTSGNCWSLHQDRDALVAYRPQDHPLLGVRHVLDRELRHLRRGVREEGSGREDLAHGPVDQSPLRSCLRKRKALLLQEAPRVLPPGGSDSGPCFLQQWQRLPDSPELAQGVAVPEHPQ